MSIPLAIHSSISCHITALIHLLAPHIRHLFTSKTYIEFYCAVWKGQGWANTTKMWVLIQRRIWIIQCLIFNQKTGKDEKRCLFNSISLFCTEINPWWMRGDMQKENQFISKYSIDYKERISSDSCLVSLPYITRALDPARTLEYALAAHPSSLQSGAASCSALCSAQCCRLCLTLDGRRGHTELIQARSNNMAGTIIQEALFVLISLYTLHSIFRSGQLDCMEMDRWTHLCGDGQKPLNNVKGHKNTDSRHISTLMVNIKTI